MTTKIKIIGNPGQQPIDILKTWLEESLKKFNLIYPEIYLIFVENTQQVKRVCQRYTKIFSSGDSSNAEIIFGQLSATAYFHENIRKEGVPPIILVNKRGEVFEDDFLDEVAHMREEKNGWLKIEEEAFELVSSDYVIILDTLTWLCLFFWLRNQFHDFFSSETMCQYGLIDETLKEKQRKLNHWIKNIFSLEKKSKIDDFNLVMAAALWITLPPSYTQKEDEEKLEEIVINYIRQMAMEAEYRKIKSIIAQLESPPRVSNIYKCGSEIIELAQEFLEK